MDLILKCLICVTLTSASAFNQRDFWSAGSLNPQRSHPDIYQLNNRNYQPRYLDEPPPEIPNERQRMNERSIAVNSGVQRVQELEKKRLQTRDEVFPRAENGSYKIVNMNPKPYPVIANRRGEVSNDEVVFPGPTSSSHSSYQPYEPDIPENCKKLGICEQINNYPHDVVNSILAELDEKIKNRLNIDILEQPEIVQRIGAGDQNIELCKFNETVVMPQAAQTETGDWYVILNQKDVPLQGYRVEICSSTSKSCANIVNFYGGYTARCKQKYVQRAMAAVDVDKREIIYDKSFRVPSCCSCVASHHDET